METSETQNHIKKPSLYTGFVTPNPIELHNDLMRQPKLSGPVLLYRTSFDNNKVVKELGYIPIFALPIQSIVINVDICLETAFIEMNVIFINNCGKEIKDALFALPMIDGTVSNISACIGNHNNDDNERYIETFLVDSEDVLNDDEDDDDNDIYDGIFSETLDDYICDLFRLPIPLIDAHDSKITMSCKWQQRLTYNEGRYHLTVPLKFGHNVLPNNVNLNEIIHINVVLNSFLSSIRFGSNTHNLIIDKTLNNSKQTHLTALCCEHNIESKDFHIAYYIETNKITGTAYIDPEDEHFILYINPITDSKYIENNNIKNNVFGRDIIFLMDRSGSMAGSSHSKGIQALNNALDMLSYPKYNDKFGIVCFNETQIYFHGIGQTKSPKQIDITSIKIIHNENEENDDIDNDQKEGYNDYVPPKCPLFEANKHYIENAKQFVVNYSPQGGTDIGTFSCFHLFAYI